MTPILPVMMLALSSASLLAQAASSLTVTQPLTVSSTLNATQTVPNGPVSAIGLTVASQGMNSFRSAITLAPIGASLPAGATGWGLYGQISVALGFPGGYGAASQTGQVAMHLASPQPVSGLLYMWPSFSHSPQFQTFAGDITVDVDCDGVPNYAASSHHERGVEIPLTLDAIGTTLCVDFSMSGSWLYSGTGSVDGRASAYWQIAFLPNTYGLETRTLGCVPMKFARRATVGWQPTVWSSATAAAVPPISFGLILVGLSEQNTPLTIPPYCHILVATPAIVFPDILSSTSVGFYPPDLVIPPGLRFYCQAVWGDAQGQVFTSDSIRTM